MGYKDPTARRAYARAWVARRRAEHMNGQACVDCGSVQNLEIDHVDASSKVEHRIWSWSEERRSAELSKCVVRCHACHMIKTLTYDARQPTHGTTSMYNRRGCRCEDCREAKKIANALRQRAS